jgi:hypothetical protein
MWGIGTNREPVHTPDFNQLLLDRNFQKTPAYFAIEQMLGDWIERIQEDL